MKLIIALAFLILGGWTTAYASTTADTVVIGGDVAEIVADLGKADVLKGRDDTALYPEQIARLPSIGYLRMLSVDSILNLSPKRVLISDDAEPQSVIKQLQASGVQVIRIAGGSTLPALEEKVRQAAIALNATSKGNVLIARIEQQRKQIAALPKIPLRAIYIMSHGGSTMIAGKGSGAANAMHLAGLEWTPDFSGYKPMGGEGLASLAPQVVLISSYGLQGVGGEQGLWKLAGLAQTPAATHHAIIKIDEVALLEFGPRTPNAILKLHQSLEAVAKSLAHD